MECINRSCHLVIGVGPGHIRPLSLAPIILGLFSCGCFSSLRKKAPLLVLYVGTCGILDVQSTLRLVQRHYICLKYWRMHISFDVHVSVSTSTERNLLSPFAFFFLEPLLWILGKRAVAAKLSDVSWWLYAQPWQSPMSTCAMFPSAFSSWKLAAIRNIGTSYSMTTYLPATPTLFHFFHLDWWHEFMGSRAATIQCETKCNQQSSS